MKGFVLCFDLNKMNFDIYKMECKTKNGFITKMESDNKEFNEKYSEYVSDDFWIKEGNSIIHDSYSKADHDNYTSEFFSKTITDGMEMFLNYLPDRVENYLREFNRDDELNLVDDLYENNFTITKKYLKRNN